MKRNRLELLFDFLTDKSSSKWVWGLSRGAKSYVAALLWLKTGIPLVFVTATHTQADDTYQDLRAFLQEKDNIFLLSARENTEQGERLKILHRLRTTPGMLLVTSLPAILQPVPSPSLLKNSIYTLRTGDTIKPQSLIERLIEGEYEFSPLVEEHGDYSSRGSIVDFFCPLYQHPIRIEFFGDTVNSIREFDSYTQRSIRETKKVLISPTSELALSRQTKSGISSTV